MNKSAQFLLNKSYFGIKKSKYICKKRYCKIPERKISLKWPWLPENVQGSTWLKSKAMFNTSSQSIVFSCFPDNYLLPRFTLLARKSYSKGLVYFLVQNNNWMSIATPYLSHDNMWFIDTTKKWRLIKVWCRFWN